jgi:D-alanyl-D-alanine carboxypeptidase/D-alanyl-D-alanine-endopeptidase (penicillin-binding protein 4)
MTMVSRPSFAALLLVLLIGCAPGLRVARPSDPVEALRYDIDAILADSIFLQARTGIMVKSIDRGEILYERDGKMLNRPASNMKLLTSAAAISLLGQEFAFTTSVHADTLSVNGILYGNLYFKGGGNPDLKSSDLDTIVQQIQLAGIQEVQGRIYADVSYFDDLFWGYGWNWDDEPYQYAAFLSPLTVNDNCIRVTVTPGSFAGEPLMVATNPSTSFITLINQGTTAADSARRPLRVTRLFKERRNTILIEGEMLVYARPAERVLSLWRPELYAAQLLKEALERSGIAIWGEPMVGTSPPGTREIALHSQRLDSMVVNLNKVSDNLSAELTLKTLGAVKRGVPGSSDQGISVLYEFLDSLGIDTTAIRVADGSGLSFYNLLTAQMLVQLLEGMAKKPEQFPLFHTSLPIAGVDGTISNRMKGTPAEGNLRAKTGTISGVSSLSGYVKTLDGETFVFSMSMQNFILPSRLYQRAQDRIGALLAGFSRTRLTAGHP